MDNSIMINQMNRMIVQLNKMINELKYGAGDEKITTLTGKINFPNLEPNKYLMTDSEKI